MDGSHITESHRLNHPFAPQYQNDDPISAFSKLCSYHIFALLQNQGRGDISTSDRVVDALLGVEEGMHKREGAEHSPASVNLRGRVFAGSANKTGGIFDKLTNTEGYTGVYKNLDGSSIGRINGYDGDISGNIRDISSLMRPNLSPSNYRGFSYT